MQNHLPVLTQFGRGVFVLVFLLVYAWQIVGFEQFTVLGELDVLELSLDLESDSEDKKNSEDIDDHLNQKDLFSFYGKNTISNSSFFMSEAAQLSYVDPFYPPPEKGLC